MALKRYDGRVKNGRWKRAVKRRGGKAPGRQATQKQRAWVKEYVANGGNGTKAALAVYDSGSRQNAYTISEYNLASVPVRRLIEEEMKRMGLTAADALRPIKEALEAKRVDKEGGETALPDHPTRLKAADMALNLMDAYPKKDEDAPKESHWHQHVHFEAQPVEITRFEVLHGRRPTPEEVARLLSGSGSE